MKELILGDAIKCLYKNERDELWIKKFVYQGIFYGSDERNKENQLLIVGYDLHEQDIRTYALKNIRSVEMMK